MLKANEVTPRQLKNVIPEICKGKIYTAPVSGMTCTITAIAISSYPARGKGRETQTRQDGSVILNRTGYAVISDTLYTSVKGYTAIEQLISCNPDVLDSETEGITSCVLDKPQRVTIIEVSEKLGDKAYDYAAFEPLD